MSTETSSQNDESMPLCCFSVLIPAKPAELVSIAKQVLHLQFTPDTLVGREDLANELHTFLTKSEQVSLPFRRALACLQHSQQARCTFQVFLEPVKQPA